MARGYSANQLSTIAAEVTITTGIAGFAFATARARLDEPTTMSLRSFRAQLIGLCGMSLKKGLASRFSIMIRATVDMSETYQFVMKGT